MFSTRPLVLLYPKTLAPLKDDTVPEIDAELPTRYKQKPEKKTMEQIEEVGTIKIKGTDITERNPRKAGRPSAEEKLLRDEAKAKGITFKR